MKTIIYSIIIVLLSGCRATKLDLELTMYANKYAYRIMDSDNETVHFTNQYRYEGSRIIFTNQDGATIDCLTCVVLENVTGDGWKTATR